MRYDERDDAELVELARTGWGPAFAVLVHRHAPTVLAATADDRDPYGATRDTFVRALRGLGDHDPSSPVGPWLLELAGRPEPATVPAADPLEVDTLWRELDARWPDGKRPRRRVPRVLVGTALAIGAIGLGIAVPVATITTTPQPEEVEPLELRAHPVADSVAEPGVPQQTSEPLPTFDFPDVQDVPGDAELDPAPSEPSQAQPPVAEPEVDPTLPPTTDDAGAVADPGAGSGTVDDSATDGTPGGATGEGATDGDAVGPVDGSGSGGSGADGGATDDSGADGDGGTDDDGATDGGSADDDGGTDDSGDADDSDDDGTTDGGAVDGVSVDDGVGDGA